MECKEYFKKANTYLYMIILFSLIIYTLSLVQIFSCSNYGFKEIPFDIFLYEKYIAKCKTIFNLLFSTIIIFLCFFRLPKNFMFCYFIPFIIFGMCLTNLILTSISISAYKNIPKDIILEYTWIFNIDYSILFCICAKCILFIPYFIFSYSNNFNGNYFDKKIGKYMSNYFYPFIIIYTKIISYFSLCKKEEEYDISKKKDELKKENDKYIELTKKTLNKHISILKEWKEKLEKEEGELTDKKNKLVKENNQFLDITFKVIDKNKELIWERPIKCEENENLYDVIKRFFHKSEQFYFSDMDKIEDEKHNTLNIFEKIKTNKIENNKTVIIKTLSEKQ